MTMKLKVNKFYLKAIFLSSFFFIINSLLFSQNLSQHNSGTLNLPPGGKMPLKFEYVDYSYKLNNLQPVSTIVSEQNFLQDISNEELEKMKTNEPNVYEYYMKADQFFKSLSPSVKSTFTVKELWYIYTYDINLTKRLRDIK